jgi:DnaA family protein
MKQIPLALGPDPAFDFDNFAAGANTQLVQALRDDALPNGPIYLWGPAGSGKSHLLHATAHRVAAVGGSVLWAGPNNPLPWDWPEEGHTAVPALAVIDDCQQLDADQQQAAFALFVKGAGAGHCILAAGVCPPVDLPLRDDLRSRLGWGLVFKTEPLTDETVDHVLHREAARRGIEISEDVTRYLQTRFARDMKSLMSLLDRLDRFSLAEKRSITVPLLKQMLLEDLS